METPVEPCHWYVSFEKPKCGVRAVDFIHVKTRLVDASVPVCAVHLAKYNDHMMIARHQRKAGKS